ncbi:uncharacterized protein LOC124776482 [Schistocerca piceifrons]|uniref:uncharacterized protein LOC124776482 n=1 Tax=Schistocerca piceifrons TaxID=274613 RepID=UPI001F5F7D5C|nr:uncharacterized protein LOC124776482 [Schistocerca piceifrons]
MSAVNTEEKLRLVLHGLLNSDCKLVDDTYLEKLLSHIPAIVGSSENGNWSTSGGLCLEWLHQVQESWQLLPPHPSLMAFALRLLAVLTHDEQRFTFLQKMNTVSIFCQKMKLQNNKNVSLNLAYTILLSSVIQHKEGRRWVLANGLWKDVINFCLSDASIYVAREGQKFVADLFSNLLKDGTPGVAAVEEIMRYAMNPVLIGRNSFAVDVKSKQDKMLPSIGIMCYVFETSMDVRNLAVLCGIINKYSLETVAWSLLNGSLDNIFVAQVSRFLALLYFVLFKYKASSSGHITLEHVKEIDASIVNLLSALFAKGFVRNALKIIVQSHFQWHEFIKIIQIDPEARKHEFENQLLALQVGPILAILSSTTISHEYFDEFCTKLTGLMHQETVRAVYAIKKMLRDQPNSHEVAHMAVLSILQIKDVMDKDKAVVVFQVLMYSLKEFMPPSVQCLPGYTIDSYDFPIEYPELLSTVLEALMMLITNFHIVWSQSVESICIFTFLSILLQNPNLSCRDAVQALKLMGEVLVSFMPPNLALLVVPVKDSSINNLGPVVRQRLHDVNWEVRDSALEVLRNVVTISEIKFPVFQDHLLEHELIGLVVAMSIDDAESYVRASAINCLCHMVKIERFWAECLFAQDLSGKMTNILKKDTEGIVRKEAAALMTELYEHDKLRKEILPVVYSTMSAAALGDLYWEVQVNALTFWEKVIDRAMVNQGMIDGAFPSVTFSKENRKIVTLTEKEIQSRLRKVLSELSQIGCLQVLLVLIQDCNMRVVCKAASVITSISKSLSEHDLLSPAAKHLPDLVMSSCTERFPDMPASRVQGPRFASNSEVDSIPTTPQKRQTETSASVINSIVQQSDMKLLQDVYRSKLSVPHPFDHRVTTICSSVSPEDFLHALGTLNIQKMIQEKNRWLEYYSDDFGSLLDDILASNEAKEYNAIDCY